MPGICILRSGNQGSAPSKATDYAVQLLALTEPITTIKDEPAAKAVARGRIAGCYE